MLNIVDMYSQTYCLCCHRYRREEVINHGCYFICRDLIMIAVVAMSHSVCHIIYNGYDVMDYSGCDLRNTVGVISPIQWI